MYRDDSGKICSISKEYEVGADVEGEAGARLFVSGTRCTEIYAVGVAGGIDIRAPLEIDIAVITMAQVESISGIEMSDEQAGVRLERPSVTLVSAESADIWELAKKYQSTPELIAAANSTADSGESVRKMLLISRAR